MRKYLFDFEVHDQKGDFSYKVVEANMIKRNDLLYFCTLENKEYSIAAGSNFFMSPLLTVHKKDTLETIGSDIFYMFYQDNNDFMYDMRHYYKISSFETKKENDLWNKCDFHCYDLSTDPIVLEELDSIKNNITSYTFRLNFNLHLEESTEHYFVDINLTDFTIVNN